MAQEKKAKVYVDKPLLDWIMTTALCVLLIWAMYVFCLVIIDIDINFIQKIYLHWNYTYFSLF